MALAVIVVDAGFIARINFDRRETARSRRPQSRPTAGKSTLASDSARSLFCFS
jgi:hypothetical protein